MRNGSSIVIAFASLFVLLCAPVQTHATSVMLLTDAQIVEQSALFVRGTVVSQKAIWAPRKLGIVTLVRIKVAEEILQRKAPAYITIRHFGGQIGNVKMQMPGNIRFNNGEEVLVALEANRYLPQGEYLVIGLTQGKWTIQPANPDPQATPTVPSTSTRLVQRAKTTANLVKLPSTTNTGTSNTGNAPTTAPKTLSKLVNYMRGHWKRYQARLKALPKIQLKKRVAPQVIKPQIPKPRLYSPIPNQPK